MAVADALRKGLKFFLMSLGISSPEKKQPPQRNETLKPGPDR
jgi:hypothetical protein